MEPDLDPLLGVEALEVCFVILAFLRHGGGPIRGVDSRCVRESSWVVGWVGRGSASCGENGIAFDEVGVSMSARSPRNLRGDVLGSRHDGMFPPPCDFAEELDIVDGDDIRVGDCGPRHVPRSDG